MPAPLHAEPPIAEVSEWRRPRSSQELYEQYANFVWRNLRRLGVPEAWVEDTVQDVFVVVHRRLVDFESRSSIQTWLFGIVLRVAQTRRRSLRRRHALEGELRAAAALDDAEVGQQDPAEATARREASRLLHSLLEQLDDDKRAILVLVELEQMSVADAAEAMNLNLNTAYTRLRAARKAFQQAVTTHGSKEPKDET